ncbi:MAG: hypothetical protein ACFFD4_00835 [Candidatus Odinarchaeota archaeon]
MKCGIAKFVNSHKNIKNSSTGQDSKQQFYSSNGTRCNNREFYSLCEVFHALTGRNFQCRVLAEHDSPETGETPARGEIRVKKSRNRPKRAFDAGGSERGG